jgi:FKBP-type peptidyl-prolyl cis-trans isomerase FkpA
MKNFGKGSIAIALSSLVMVSACKDDAGSANGDASFKNAEDSVSYCLGIWSGKTMKESGLAELNEELFLSAVKETMDDKETKLKPEEATAFLQAYFGKLEKKKGEANLDEGKKFLENNKSKAGVKTTASGLQYEVITEGKGASPKAEETVTVNYKGTLLDGTVFDSSYDRGQPATFPLNQVIPGWTEGIPLMKVGSKYKFYIPSELAYGDRSQGKIKANSVLIFEVELLEINPAAK